MKHSILIPSVTAFFTLVAAQAVDTPPGETLGSFESSNGVSEFCSAPRALDLDATVATSQPAYLAFRDFEQKSAKKTCRADFYDTRESTAEETAVVVCPKLGSTNPSVMMHELPFGMSRAQFIAKECPKVKDRAGDTIAKFKQSVSCSYTPSILSYPRVGAMLRSEIEMPFTVYRSMDRREHLEIAAAAKDLAARVAGRDSLIAQTWRTIYSDDANPSASPRRAGLYRDGNTLIFGGLVPDTKGDEIYWEANGSAAGDRVANFQKTAAFAMVASAKPVSSWGLDKEFTPAVAQKLVLLREMGDLIVLDTLLNQQDRFGNLHTRPHYLAVGADGAFDWKLAKKKKKTELTPEEAARAKKGEFIPDPKQAADMAAKGYLLLNRMLMADNDCGVAKENRMAKAGIAAKVAHLHPDTYLAVQRLQSLAAKGALANYLRSELLFTTRDVTSVQANLASLARTLKTRCLAGQLRLDADLAQHLGLKPAVDSVAFCRAN
jgi:hypothetical protein